MEMDLHTTKYMYSKYYTDTSIETHSIEVSLPNRDLL